jgi:beta-N-acetylhexosaminidase
MASEQLSRAAGKLITGRIPGTALESEHRHCIESGVMSGVTLFRENACRLEDLCVLVEDLRSAGGDDFIIAVDQEGGAVQRLDQVISSLPSAMALASVGDAQFLISNLLNMAARQLSEIGINVNLVPVLDINSNPLNPIIGTRCFGDDADTVIRLGELMASAYAAHGVLPVGKHFPGHGDTAEDSHLQLAVCRAPMSVLEQRELKPFAALSRKFESLLVGHVWLPSLDEKPLPASLSKAVTGDLLRRKMQFDGFVFTDDLPVMKAIVDNWGLGEACVMAINAGADNLLVSGSVQQIEEAHGAVVAAVDSAVIPHETLELAIARRERTVSKRVRKLDGIGQRLQNIEALTKQIAPLALQLSASAICCLKGTVPDVVQDADRYVIVSPIHARYDLALSQVLKGVAGASLREIRVPLNPQARQIEDTLAAVSGKLPIVLTFRALLHDGQLQLARRIASENAAATVVAMDVPYELAALDQFANQFATLDPSSNALQALSMVLAKKVRPSGNCPVRVTFAQ